jgi:hypothetical protein
MAAPRFRIGQRVRLAQKSCAGLDPSADLFVIEQLTGDREPLYVIRVANELQEYVFSESDLDRARIDGTGRDLGCVSPWSA